MNSSGTALPIDIPAVSNFWVSCFERIQMHSNSALFGEQENTGLIPPTFQYSDDRAEASARAQGVLQGKITTIVTPQRDFTDQGVGLPAVGDMAIICDGDGEPTALISNTAVTTEPLESSPHDRQVVETFEVLYP